MLQELLIANIHLALKSDSLEDQKSAIDMIPYVSHVEQSNLIRTAFQLSSPELRKSVARIIGYIPKSEQKDLLNLYRELQAKDAPGLLISTPLYL